MGYNYKCKSKEDRQYNGEKKRDKWAKKRRESKMDRQHTSQTKKDKQRFSNLYIENQRSSNMNPT
jgi:hypothetical protein